jgi:superfamily II DNA/RNA helicase
MSQAPNTIANLDVKRVRRVLEPEQKNWNDDLLETPWDDVKPPLSKHTVFAMKNIFFFSHATSVQSAAIPKLATLGTSCVVEAPTGCGKTLAFLVPIMERLVRHCDAHVSAFGRPLLTRNIVAIVLSPSRVLAEQTYVVARGLAARFPHDIRMALCDGVSETPEATVEHLSKGSRGGGVVLISTPADVLDFLTAYDAHRQKRETNGLTSNHQSDKRSGGVEVTDELLEEQDEETKRRYLAKQARKESEQRSTVAPKPVPSSAPTTNGEELILRAHAGTPFFLIVDEADVVLKAPTMRDAVVQVVHQRLVPIHREAAAAAAAAATDSSVKKGAAKSQKRLREEDSGSQPALVKAMLDVGLFGATAGYSKKVQQFASAVEGLCHTTFSNVFLRRETADTFVSQLSNKYCLCESQHVLHTLIHFLNLHPCKKHFIFFNSSAVLMFVKTLLMTMSEGKRPMLYVKHIYAMYEEMKESTKFAEYNNFLQHTPVALASVHKAALAIKHMKEEKNPHFSSGWKRDSRPPPGTGAILLCTDVAAFGLDVRDVDYVYHFEPPVSLRSYVHRIGRVGRMGMRGTSVLLLPVPSSDNQNEKQQKLMDRERKSTSHKFHTIANTKSSTSALQGSTVDESDLEEEKAKYLEQLQQSHKLERQGLPPVAPITAMIRGVIAGHSGLQRLGRSAAMQLCKPRIVEETPTGEGDDAADDAPPVTEPSWYDAPLALQTLLLD